MICTETQSDQIKTRSINHRRRDINKSSHIIRTSIIRIKNKNISREDNKQ